MLNKRKNVLKSSYVSTTFLADLCCNQLFVGYITNTCDFGIFGFAQPNYRVDDFFHFS